ncbi:FAD binding domain-containing protein [Fulvivirgaceae bacterium BMA12]|uniref:FAD binding domain-containing protein n=1 Tax=Agaribacillus aureus TaxID=3051825 RepID=A0ABT8LB30_9BACT|nr:FAD binding domain-containing protein [Fulvivirgaceae bacterium BMA12]
MNKFSWYDAKTVNDALEQVNATVSEVLASKVSDQSAVFKCGGTDLLDMMKEGLVAPKKIVNIKNIAGLDAISYHQKSGLKIGANVTLAQMEANAEIKQNYLALHQAVAHAGTPQIRNMASLGGNLAQRTRCWYFRSLDHECLRKGSGTCFARNGENEFHAIMKNGSCSSVHASSVSTALMAFDASVEIAAADGKKRTVKMTEFFVTPGDDSSRESILEANELITAVIIPPSGSKTKSYYIKQGARESYDWAIADVAVVLEVSGSKCKNANIVLGAAAPVPIRSEAASTALIGKEITEQTAKDSAEASMKGATPLSKNAYKVPLFKAIVKRAILKTT